MRIVSTYLRRRPVNGRVDAAGRSRRRRGAVAPPPLGGRADAAAYPSQSQPRRSHKKNGSYASLHEAAEAYDRVARAQGLPVNVPQTILEAIRCLIAAVLFYGTRGGGVTVGPAASPR